MKTLTAKQEKFCINFLLSNNATDAAIKAGYSKDTAVVIASQNLTKTNIKNRLKELRDRTESAKVMTVQERKEMLTLIARFGGKLSIPAIAELNKMGGDYTPTNNEKQNLNVNVNVGILNAKDLSDDELATIAARGGHRVIEQKASKESSTTLLPVHDVNIREGEASIPSS
jgi:phage terminase small subunit